MAVKQTKKFSDVSVVSTVSTSQFIPLTDSSGNVTRVSLASLKAVLLAGMDLKELNDGVFIMFHRNSDNYPLAVKPHKWPDYQSSGEIAEGVLVLEGDKMLVIAPTEATLYWSSTAVSGGVTPSDRLAALGDWNGKTSTNAQVTHTECRGNSYAPGFCHNYSRVNANGQGMTAGKWWLPSLGEMMMIYANMAKINYALSLINGATQLEENTYWTSTEYSATYAYYMFLSYGLADAWGTKSAYLCRVRPVSAFV